MAVGHSFCGWAENFAAPSCVLELIFAVTIYPGSFYSFLKIPNYILHPIKLDY